MGYSPGCVYISGPLWTSLPHRGLLHRLPGNLCSSAWSTFSPSSLALVSAELFFSHVLAPLSQLLYLPAVFFPLLTCIIPEVLPPSLMGLALAGSRSVLELVALAVSDMGEDFSFSQKSSL